MPASRQAWLFGILALALPVLALVFKLPSETAILRVLQNAAHAPVFAATAVAWLALLRTCPGIPRSAAFVGAWLLAVAAGGAIELVQPSIGRGAEWGDVWNDALGATAGLSVAALWGARGSRTLLRGHWPAVCLLLVATAICLWPVTQATLAYAVRAGRFPTLFVDEMRLDRYFLRGRGVELAHVAPAGLSVRITGDRFPGVSLIEPRPDWTGYRRLMLDLANPGDRAIALTLRVHDARHDNRLSDRFNRLITLDPRSRQTIAISLADIAAAPADRRLDLGQVAGLILFSAGAAAERGQIWQIMRIWLE